MATSTDIQNLDGGSERARVTPDSVKRASASRESFRKRARQVDEERGRSGGVWNTIRKVFGTALVAGGIGALIWALFWRNAGRNIPIFDPAPGAARVAAQGAPPVGTTILPEFTPNPNSSFPSVPPTDRDFNYFPPPNLDSSNPS